MNRRRGSGMPVPRRGGDGIPPTAAVALVQRVYSRGGHGYFDAWEPDSGQMWKGIPAPSGGGSEDGHSLAPVFADPDDDHPTNASKTIASQVVLVFSGQNRTGAKYAGTIEPTPVERVDAADDELDADDDHPLDVSLHSFFLRLAGVRLLLDEEGHLVIDLSEAKDTTLRVQLGDEGVLRVSRKGKAAERLLLAGPTREAYDKLVERVNLIGQGLAALTVSGGAMTPAVLANSYSHEEAAKSTGAMVSSAVKVSDDSEG